MILKSIAGFGILVVAAGLWAGISALQAYIVDRSLRYWGFHAALLLVELVGLGIIIALSVSVGTALFGEG